MAKPGEAGISLKEGPWRGMTALNSSKPLHFDLLENCYVSSDGGEIRAWPGYICVIDPESTPRALNADTTEGYRATHIDAARPVLEDGSGSTNADYRVPATATSEMEIYTEPANMFCVQQVGGRWVFVGESDFRREPLLGASGAFVSITAVRVVGGNLELELNENILGGPTAIRDFNNLYAATSGVAHYTGVPTFSIWSRLYVDGITGAFAAALNGKGHVAIGQPAQNKITLDRAFGATPDATGLTGTVARVTNISDQSATPISDDVPSLTTWTSFNLGDPDTDPATTVYTAHVANRQRDFGDRASTDATSTTREGVFGINPAGANWVHYPRSRRRQKTLPYRPVPHVAGSRLILAAPGYGCVFQIPNLVPVDGTPGSPVPARGIAYRTNDVFDRPRSLGIPKAVQYGDDGPASAITNFHIYDVGDVTRAFGGKHASVAGRVGAYQYRFAYRDDSTGEVGLWSEPISVTTSNDAGGPDYQGLRFAIYFPGYLMHETLALTILAWRTKRGETTPFYFDGVVDVIAPTLTTAEYGGTKSYKYGLMPDMTAATVGAASPGDYWQHAIYTPHYKTDDDLAAAGSVGPVPTINEMPMGCKAARTIRGFTMLGGALGDAGSLLQLQSGKITLDCDYNGTASDLNPFWNEVTSRHSSTYSGQGNTSFEGVDTGFGCAKTSIPSSYSGQYMMSPTLFPFGITVARIQKVLNTVFPWDIPYWTSASNGPMPERYRLPDLRYEISDTPLIRGKIYAARGQTSYLVLPRGLMQVSEPDNPGVTPDTNITLISSEDSQDIEAIGDANGMGVICTRDRTYSLGFSQSPIGVPPDISSSEFGCIAANSMVSFDGGVAWISDRGPCIVSGGVVQWIGRDLEPWFHGSAARYKRDSQGMMRHAWAAHDAERGLLYFGVFADRNTGTVTVTWNGATYNWTQAEAHADADKILSRFPCDEILAFSYATGAWSVWRPPSSIAIQWMTSGNDANGSKRMFFLGNDRRLYAMDDSWAVMSKEASQAPIVVTPGTYSTFAVTTSLATRAGAPAMVYDSETGRVRHVGTVDTVGVNTVTLNAPVTITGGEYILVGHREMTVRSTFFNAKQGNTSFQGSTAVKYDLRSKLSYESNGLLQHCFLGGTIRSHTKADGEHVFYSSPMSADDGDVVPTAQWTSAGSTTSSSTAVLTERLELGMGSGTSHQVEIRAIGGAQMRIQDIIVGVQ